MTYAAPHWHDWQPGDIVRCREAEHGNETVGKEYVVYRVVPGNLRFGLWIKRDDNGNPNEYDARKWDWVCRPSSSTRAAILSQRLDALDAWADAIKSKSDVKPLPEAQPRACTCDFSGPNCWAGCRCGAIERRSA